MRWLRFAGGFGYLDGDTVHVCRGELFAGAEPTGETRPVADLEWLPPCVPSKMIALAGNFGEHIPTEPIYFIKTPNTFAAHGAAIRKPRCFEGRVLFEGELGVVIGKAGRDIPLEATGEHIFGYTYWTRAKGFDGFGPFGPTITTGVDPAALTVRTVAEVSSRRSDLLASSAG